MLEGWCEGGGGGVRRVKEGGVRRVLEGCEKGVRRVVRGGGGVA